jgi:DNA-binding MarR family transcriptional regulator
MAAERDQIDALVAQWEKERPDLDLAAMATVARLLNVGRLLGEELGRTAAEYGVQVPEADVLFTLRRSGGPYRLSPSAISDSLLVSSGTLTSRLDRLEAKGLIERVPHATDRRSMEVALTAKGNELVDRAVGDHVEREGRILSALTEAQRDELDELMRLLLAKLSAD